VLRRWSGEGIEPPSRVRGPLFASGMVVLLRDGSPCRCAEEATPTASMAAVTTTPGHGGGPAGGYDSAMENDTLIAAEQDQLDEVDDELLVEEISIDGMCGVY
jgi:mycofactocin precursor